MSKITAMRTKLDQGQIGHLYFMFIKYHISLHRGTPKKYMRYVKECG